MSAGDDGANGGSNTPTMQHVEPLPTVGLPPSLSDEKVAAVKATGGEGAEDWKGEKGEETGCCGRHSETAPVLEAPLGEIHCVRRYCYHVIASAWFDPVINIIVVLNCVTLAAVHIYICV